MVCFWHYFNIYRIKTTLAIVYMPKILKKISATETSGYIYNCNTVNMKFSELLLKQISTINWTGFKVYNTLVLSYPSRK